MEVCVLCKETDGQMNEVGHKGYRTLLRTSLERGKQELHDELERLTSLKSPILVHHNCRRRFVDIRRTEPKEEEKVKRLRSSLSGVTFDWKTFCFICGKVVDIGRHKERGQVRRVSTLPLHANLVKCATDRNDDWGRAVLHRLESCIDLIAAEAIYHLDCASKFRLKTDELSNKRGRPTNADMTESFDNLCDWLENSGESEVYSVNELYQKMTEDSPVCYSKKAFRGKLKDRFKDHVYFLASTGNRGELVCFKSMTDYIIRHFKEGSETKETIIRAAAKLIKEDIREASLNKEYYPSSEDISDIENRSFVPETLQSLMKFLVPSTLKRESLCQCIVQTARPRSSIMPIPFGIGVEVDKTIGSKWLIEHLHRLGFSISYDEVNRFKQSAIENMDRVQEENEGAPDEKEDATDENGVAADENEVVPDENEDPFVQWIADNVDHNIDTLTGKETFHGMGIICSNSKIGGKFGSIPRLKKKPATSFIEGRGVEIIHYKKSPKLGLAKIKLEPIQKMISSPSQSAMETYNLLWNSAWMFTPPETPRPNWSGFLQCSTKSIISNPGRSDVSFLPIIDLNPSDETCIYSTLCFVISESKKLNVQTPCITFDQPLWIKALGIIYSENLSIICRLGGFHTLMSFLGSIGEIMKGSGIEDLLAEVYAENSIPHILSGKAIARAIRGHILVESSLNSLLLKMVNESNDVDFEKLQDFYFDSLQGELTQDRFTELAENPTFQKVRGELSKLKATLMEKSRTAKLWLVYMEYVHLVKMFIFAERTSDWELHLFTLQKMLNLFAATGHINYAKCARLYLQEMKSLPQRNPWVYNQLIRGQHTVRRTERNWTGIWTDLAIEQTLMRSLKTRGGLTVGRGMTESVRHQWVLSLNHSASIHDAMVQLTKANNKSSEQHYEMGASRTKQDYKDCEKLLGWFEERNPFLVPGVDLYALSSGLVSVNGKDMVNCEEAEIIGESIQKKVDNLMFNEIIVKRNDKVKSLNSLFDKSSSTEEKIADPKIMFTRMIAIAEREDDLESFFEYEMTTEPMALFKDGMLRKPDKPALRKIIMPEECSITKDKIPERSGIVLDGGALLHRVRWAKGTRFKAIAQAYLQYICKHYDLSSVVVFDGYEDESIKSHEHQRRNMVPQSCDVKVNPENQMPFTQERFLSNIANKASFIHFLSDYLLGSGIRVVNCRGDADATIVQTALEIARDSVQPVLVVADDTDIAVMLVHHWEEAHSDVYFFQERWNRAWSVRESTKRNEDIKDHLLFLHAFSGCDTTSAIYSKGKANLISTFKKTDALRRVSEVISSPWSTQEEVGDASVMAVKILYGGKEEDTIQRLRYIG